MIVGYQVFLHEGVTATVRAFWAPLMQNIVVASRAGVGNGGAAHDYDFDRDLGPQVHILAPAVTPITALPGFTDHYQMWAPVWSADLDGWGQWRWDSASGNQAENTYFFLNPMIRWLMAASSFLLGEAQPMFAPSDYQDSIFLSGSIEQIDASEAKGVDLILLTRGPRTNDWYGTGNTGKFGWVTEIYEDGMRGEMHFLNFDRVRILFKQG